MFETRWMVRFVVPALAQVAILSSLSADAWAADYAMGNLALTPGADASQLNLNWTMTSVGTGQCKVEIAKESTGLSHSTNFTATSAPGADANKDGLPDYYYCAVTVTGLKNQVDYVYRLGDGAGLFSDTYQYSTKNRNRFGFAFLSDAQIGIGGLASDTLGWTNTVSTIASYFPETAFVVSTGDQIEIPGNEAQWSGFFAPEALSSIPIAPTTGSHDELGNGKGFSAPSSYAFDYHFNLPNESAHGLLGSYVTAAGDYFFTYGAALIMMLNMDSPDFGSHESFMQAAIAANPEAKWRIAAWHYTIYTAAARGTMPAGAREALVPLMDENDVDVVLMGHDHTYCRTHQMYNFMPQAVETNCQGDVINPEGTVYVTADSASGSKYYDLASDVADPVTRFWIAAYAQPLAPTFSYVDVDANSLRITTYRTDTMGVVDTYTIRKSD